MRVVHVANVCTQLGAPPRKTITQTFRLDTKIHEALVAEAHGQGVSLNVLVNHVLEDYALYGRYTDKFKDARLSRQLLASFLNELPEQAIRTLGSTYGATHPKHALSVFGFSFDLENAERLLQEFLTKHYHWFDAFIKTVEDVWVVHLSHGVSRKWSFFVSEYTRAMFDMLGFQTIEVGEEDHYANLRLKRQMK